MGLAGTPITLVAVGLLVTGAASAGAQKDGSPARQSQPVVAPAPVTQCDRLATMLRHPDAAVSHDVGFLLLKPKPTIAACRLARKAHPKERRFNYLLARAYNRAEKYKLARKFYRAAARQGDSHAMLSLATMAIRGQGTRVNLKAAFKWAQQASETGHPAGLAELSRYYRSGVGVTYDPKRAFDLAKQSAATGWSSGMSLLATYYRQGIGTRKDPLAADILLRRVFQFEQTMAGKDEGLAMLRLGWAYLNGRGVDKNVKTAVAWYRRALKAGHSGAYNALGWAHKKGLGVSKWGIKSCDFYEKAARHLRASALNNYALCFQTGLGRDNDLVRARRLFERSMARGNAYAPRNLAKMYDQGKGVKKNTGKAARLYKLSAERGLTASMLTYGWRLDQGIGVKANAKVSCDWYERAMDRGSNAATNNVAFCYETGKGRPKNPTKAIRLFERAATNGHALAMRNLAIRFEEGRGVERDQGRANNLYESAATAGSLDAMVRLGLNIFNGKGTKADHKIGCDWFERAADKGSAIAVNNLASCFASGEGRKQDVRRATKLFDKAVAGSSPLAMRNLASRLYNGTAVKRDRSRAARLFARAAKAGETVSVFRHAHNLFWGSGLKLNKVAACRWFDKASANSQTKALSAPYLGLCWEKGHGRKRNRRKAFAAYKASAQSGSMAGMQSLGRAYDEAVGVRRDGEKAAYWLRKSLAAGNAFLARRLISAPHQWHISTRRELQRLLQQEGHYKGPLSGRFNAPTDQAIWNHAVGGDGSARRLVQEFARVPLIGAPKGIFVRICRQQQPQSSPAQRLIVINHGLTTNSAERRRVRAGVCGPVAEFFTSRGFTVAFPVRRGYGATAGRFREGARGGCRSRNYIKAGNEIARDIGAVVAALTKRPGIAPGNAIVVGHSGGGWGTAALAGKNPGGVSGYINFSGGHGTRKGVPGTFCPKSLTAAMANFGRSARKPILWIYVKNDSFIGPRMARRMFKAYRAGAPRAKLVMMPKYRPEGHYLFDSDGMHVWGPAIDKWLAANFKISTATR